MAYTTIDDPTAHFQVKTYTGNYDTNAITLDGDSNLQGDLIWLKQRDDATDGWHCYDSVRGVAEQLRLDDNRAESTTSGILASFNTDGFTLGANNAVNQDGSSHIAYVWKGANGTATNTAGDKDSTVSVNTTAGISIVKWNNNKSNAINIGHGLGAIPDAVIVKDEDSVANWHSRFKSFAANDYIALNNNEAKGASTSVFATLPTSTLFYTGTAAYHINTNCIAYCFTSIQGFSKIGTYTGNNNADGSFVYCGFRPAWVMTRALDTSNWYIWDNKTSTHNEMNTSLSVNQTIAEETSREIDFLSNGFKPREARGSHNDTGEFIYMAFAEAPFVNSNGVPCNAS